MKAIKKDKKPKQRFYLQGLLVNGEIYNGETFAFTKKQALAQFLIRTFSVKSKKRLGALYHQVEDQTERKVLTSLEYAARLAEKKNKTVSQSVNVVNNTNKAPAQQSFFDFVHGQNRAANHFAAIQ